MKLSKHQKKTKLLVEKRLGYSIPEKLIKPFFNKTDKGIEPEDTVDRQAFSFIMQAFRIIAWDFNCYVEDFRAGFLFLSDFENDDFATKELALRAYRAATEVETTYCRKYYNHWFKKQN